MIGEIFVGEIFVIFPDFGEIRENLSRKTSKFLHSGKYIEQRCF